MFGDIGKMIGGAIGGPVGGILGEMGGNIVGDLLDGGDFNPLESALGGLLNGGLPDVFGSLFAGNEAVAGGIV